MSGYWQRRDATSDAITEGWLHSGDLARQDDDGFLYIVDRKKEMIIYCAEVENALTAHPEVAEAAVIGRADDRWGEVAVAVVVLTDTLGMAGLPEFLGSRLAGFKHPKDRVVVDALPCNAGGKVLKAELREEFGSKDTGLAS